MWFPRPCSFISPSTHSSIISYPNSFLPLVGCTLIRIREDFWREIFLKQHLARFLLGGRKKCLAGQAKSLNCCASTLMRSQTFGLFFPMRGWCLAEARVHTAGHKERTHFPSPHFFQHNKTSAEGGSILIKCLSFVFFPSCPVILWRIL